MKKREHELIANFTSDLENELGEIRDDIRSLWQKIEKKLGSKEPDSEAHEILWKVSNMFVKLDKVTDDIQVKISDIDSNLWEEYERNWGRYRY